MECRLLFPSLWAAFLFLALFSQGTIQDDDPFENFCRRWGHQAAVVDDKIYYDGGLATYSGPATNLTNYTSTFLISYDLSREENGMPSPLTTLNKPYNVPSVNGGILWPDTVNKRIYLYGGQFYKETPSELQLWNYDILHNKWENTSIDGNYSRSSYGAGVSIQNTGVAYYYGGWHNNETNSEWKNDPETTSQFLSYTMDQDQWKTLTSPDDKGRAEGVMLYIPAGNMGMLIYFGGVRGVDKEGWESQPMNEIMIYDISTKTWFNQNTTGDTPRSRRRFCAGVTWPDDYSSYNIYIYGGLGEKDGSAGFDDAYILTLPTFTWIRAWSYKGTPNPHHSLTCNVVNQAQMLINGGFFTMNNNCDTEPHGNHNAQLNTTGGRFWLRWLPDEINYQIPDKVISIIGGTVNGSATKTSPVGGWDSPNLGTYMASQASATQRKPTRNVGGSRVDAGTISGAVIGGAIGVGFILAGMWYFIRKRGVQGSQNSQQCQQLPINDSEFNNSPQMTSHPESINIDSVQATPVAFQSLQGDLEPAKLTELSTGDYVLELPSTELPVEADSAGLPPGELAGSGSPEYIHGATKAITQNLLDTTDGNKSQPTSHAYSTLEVCHELDASFDTNTRG